jgi:hypothetical protein
MVIENFFLYYKKPAQYLYWGENYIDYFAVPGTDKTLKKLKTFDGISLTESNSDRFQAIARELTANETGVILNSNHFIFNIFDFEKIPFQESLQKDLVEWRLKKVFPENIVDYEHHYYQLNRTRILSVLMKKSLKETIQQLFDDNSIPLIHIGNSTIEAINHMTKLKKTAPDFLVEIDAHLCLAVFQEQGVPYYIRKFRCEKAEDLVAEVTRTINYVKNSYSKIPATYSITTDRTHSDLDYSLIHDELAALDVSEMGILDRESICFPGKK